MSKGVTRNVQVRAQEQLDKQERQVERLKVKVQALEMELRAKRVELHNEEEILKYYLQHPALQEGNDLDISQIQDALPLEEAR